MPDSDGISGQILKMWKALLASLPKALRERWTRIFGRDIESFIRVLREARGSDEVLKILVELIKDIDPKETLIVLSSILKLLKIAWPESGPIISNLVTVLRWMAEAFEEAAHKEGAS
jgi:hypothetical protein